MVDNFSPVGAPCSICGDTYDAEEWGVLGWIGILPLSLCPICQDGIFTMVYSLTPVEDLEELIKEYKPV